MKVYNKIKVIMCVILFSAPLIASAQDDLGGGNGNGDVADTPAAPIENWIPILALGGIVLAYQVTKKKAIL